MRVVAAQLLGEKVVVTFTDGSTVEVELDPRKGQIRSGAYWWNADAALRGEVAGSIWSRGQKRQHLDLETLVGPEEEDEDEGHYGWYVERTRTLRAVLFVVDLVMA